MAQKQKQHGKVERRQVRANVRFQPGFLLLLILLTFAGCFALYMITATAQEDYWEREIVASMEQENAARAGKSGRSGITNPVPSSERAEDSRMGEVAFIGDVATLVTYYETNSGLIFTDAVTDMAESRMRSVARSLRGSSPRAVYLWYQCPEDLEAAADSLKALVNNLYAQIPETPVYLLSATPGTDSCLHLCLHCLFGCFYVPYMRLVANDISDISHY